MANKIKQPDPDRVYSINKAWREGFFGNRTRADVTGIVKYDPMFSDCYVSGEGTGTRHELKGSTIIKWQEKNAPQRS